MSGNKKVQVPENLHHFALSMPSGGDQLTGAVFRTQGRTWKSVREPAAIRT